VTPARAIVVDALTRIDDGAFSHILVPELLRRADLDGRDRALVTAFTFGAVRMQRVLDDALASVSKRPLPELEPQVRAALRLGAFQLYDGVAPHAAVGETVAVVPARVRPYVNGVLRALARRAPQWPTVDSTSPDAALGARTSHPDWLVARLLRQFGRADAVAMLTLDNRPPSVTLRPNHLRVTGEVLRSELAAAGVVSAGGELVAGAVVLSQPGDPNAIAAVRDGRATPQDQASQAVAAMVDARPGMRVLDVAAAPGGKATALAEVMHDEGVVVAADVHRGRVELVSRAASRLHLRSVAPFVADGTRPPFAPRSFDRVLLDAPCSGLGVLRRRAEARWRVTEDDISTLAALQRELLAAAATLVRPGGRLVYSVCTVSDEETTGIDDWARDALPAFTALAPAPAPWRPHGRGALLLPHDAGTDGMFLLVLEARG
jgi:16S rRNA (cytosine967-C5)-methyltransferase